MLVQVSVRAMLSGLQYLLRERRQDRVRQVRVQFSVLARNADGA